MCGRFVLFSSGSALQEFFETLPMAIAIAPNYNAAPTQEIPVIIQRRDGRRIEIHHWGLVPFWAKDTAIGTRMINARVETLASKPAFRAAVKQRRCLVPANGFYEWKGKAGAKQPFYFSLPSGEPLAFAGLWEIWEEKTESETASVYKSFTIITTEASDSVRDVHRRMPVILKPEAYAAWLDPENKDPENLLQILVASGVKELKRHPVSKLVNRVSNNGKECIEPAED